MLGDSWSKIDICYKSFILRISYFMILKILSLFFRMQNDFRRFLKIKLFKNLDQIIDIVITEVTCCAVLPKGWIFIFLDVSFFIEKWPLVAHRAIIHPPPGRAFVCAKLFEFALRWGRWGLNKTLFCIQRQFSKWKALVR